jgi:methyl-accepting chemotaxis protein
MLKNFKIGTRLGLGFGAILVLLMIVGGSSIMDIKALHRQIDLLVTDRMVKVEQANTIIDDINTVARALRNIYIDDNKERQATNSAGSPMPEKDAGGILDEFNEPSPTRRAWLLKKMTDCPPRILRHLEAYIDFIRMTNHPAKNLLLGEIRQIQSTYMQRSRTDHLSDRTWPPMTARWQERAPGQRP